MDNLSHLIAYVSDQFPKLETFEYRPPTNQIFPLPPLEQMRDRCNNLVDSFHENLKKYVDQIGNLCIPLSETDLLKIFEVFRIL